MISVWLVTPSSAMPANLHMRLLRSCCSALLSLVLLAIGCERRSVPATTSPVVQTSPKSPQEVSRMLKLLVQAPLPTNATEVFGRSRAIFTEIVQVRFNCSPQELDTFLEQSPVLADRLQPGNSSGVDNDSTTAWWRPGELTNVMSSSQRWRKGRDEVFCDVLAGQRGDTNSVTVYLWFILEEQRPAAER